MTAEVLKYTLDQVEALEVAPGTEHEQLEGWVPTLATDDELREALAKALDYRGDVTLTLKSGERGKAPEKIEAFIFNCKNAATLADSWVQYFSPTAPEKRKVSFAQIARIEFSGKDRAAGKHWEDWVKKYAEKKAAGETNIALAPEALE
jgi:tRNA splicing ligase